MPTGFTGFCKLPRLMGSRHYRTMRFDAHLSEASRDVARGAFHGTMGDRVILPWDDQF